MASAEFEILVSASRVAYTWQPVGETLPVEDDDKLELDELTLQTVQVMARWLNFWQRIVKPDIRHGRLLFGADTFQVVGRHLWNLILRNKVGDALVRHLDEPSSEPLRLVLTFTDNARDSLKGLPWEFLHHPEHGFLAAQTNLLLTRFVQLETTARRPAVTPVQSDQVRALFIGALPQEDDTSPDAKHGHLRAQLQRLAENLKDIPRLDVLEPIYAWDREVVREHLSNPAKPCHIVHVIGICRGTPPEPPRILLGSQGDFEDPQELVDVLTSGPTKPKLVILHLGDYVDGDASESFEALAPALIRKDVPAVLALQYAGRADDVGVGKAFYESLVAGTQVGQAVQDSRMHLAETLDRRFATPVLYLGNDGSLWKDPTAVPTSGNVVESRTRAADPGVSAMAVKRALIQVVDEDLGLGTTHKATAIGWISQLALGAEPVPEARRELMLALRQAPDDVTMDLYGRMLRRLLRLETSR
ncbi:MAG: CHAT domain-containing protein [Nocardioides sp.]